MELCFCNAVMISQISGDFLWGCNTSHDSRTGPEQTSAAVIDANLTSSANLTLCDHVNEFSLLLVV